MTTVKEIMSKKVETVDPSATVVMASKIMKRHKIGGLVIVKDKKPVGIITERDIVYKLVSGGMGFNTKVDKIMSKDVQTIKKDQDMIDAAEIMISLLIRRLPVVDKSGKLIGIITADDVLKANLNTLYVISIGLELLRGVA